MWIIDIPDMELQSIYSKILEPNRAYTLGRQNTDITILDEKKKLSRKQLSITIANDDLNISNIGQALFSVNNESLPKKFQLSYHSSEVHNEITFQMLNNSWYFKLFHINLNTIQIGDKGLHNKLTKIGLINFELDENLNDDQILIGDNIKPIIIESHWIDELLKAQWKKNGGLNKLITPELESKRKLKRTLINTSNSNSDSDSSDHDDLLPNRGKSQLDTMLDKWDVFEPIQIEKSQNRAEDKKIKDQDKKIEDKDTKINESLGKLSLKRTTDQEPSNSHKKLKTASYLKIDLTQQEEEPVETAMRQENNDKLVDAFKKVKEIRKNAVERDKELISSYKINSDIKIKKFSIDMTLNQTNKKYRNCPSSDKPEWENRVNFKTFRKITNGYNPITDSTIKCIKLKKADYKSNTLQINIDDQFLNEPIPELDNQFNNPTRKRGMEWVVGKTSRKKQLKDDQQSLFLTDDYDDDNADDGNDGVSFISKRFQGIKSSRNFTQNTIPINQLNTTKSDDDDIPVFKSRRR